MVNYCKSKKSLVGKTAIITGANTGIGYETALEFAKRGCRVIMACRNQEKANAAREKIVQATGNENIVVKSINLDSLASVRDFAKYINETEDRLDLLINNAGAAQLPDKTTEDGLQLEMACNYFAPFLLTILLLDLLKKSAPSRIVNVSSAAAKMIHNLNLEELNKYGGWMLYCRTKLCQIYFTQELAKRLEGTNVTTYSLHPGAINSEFYKGSAIGSWVGSKVFKTSEEGAQTSIYLALEDGIEEHNGEHFEDCKRVKPYCGAKDDEKRKKLWEISEEMVGLRQK
ncbi:retinol dehydrogenase 11-like [Zophobas morio]|uniref:retinol dehydrogenase 11-like n=1 Tax=Zophobas morio TaxID=2755281 RepID=UPI00308344EF